MCHLFCKKVTSFSHNKVAFKFVKITFDFPLSIIPLKVFFRSKFSLGQHLAQIKLFHNHLNPEQIKLEKI